MSPRWIKSLISALLTSLAIQPRSFFALTRSFLLIDLRGQFYGKATGTSPEHCISPLFWVVGQCLTISAIVSFILWLSVDTFFFTFACLTTSIAVMASAVLVEFSEVVLDPKDLDVLGHHPWTPRTYAAARLANMAVYFLLLYAALNLLPLILGSSLDDAGVWYMPAYLLASVSANLITACMVILCLGVRGNSSRLDQWKASLAWTQILLILVAFYGAQAVLRDHDYSLELWAAFPPSWIEYLPPAWFAHFVDSTSRGPTSATCLAGSLIVCITFVVAAVTIGRVSSWYRALHPAIVSPHVIRMTPNCVGTLTRPLSKLLGRTREERVGMWLCQAFLRRDAGLRMRCLIPLNVPFAVVTVGLLADQFANPIIEHAPRQITLSVLSVYLIALSVPPMVYAFAFSDEFDAAWIMHAAPAHRPESLALGICRWMHWYILLPLCLCLGLVQAVAWDDALAGLLHATLAWLLAWPAALAALWLVMPGRPFSLPAARGSVFGPLALPMAAFSTITAILGALHCYFASNGWFWGIMFLLCVIPCPGLKRRVRRHFQSINSL